jgi:hypothetical protein
MVNALLQDDVEALELLLLLVVELLLWEELGVEPLLLGSQQNQVPLGQQ